MRVRQLTDDGTKQKPTKDGVSTMEKDKKELIKMLAGLSLAELMEELEIMKQYPEDEDDPEFRAAVENVIAYRVHRALNQK